MSTRRFAQCESRTQSGDGARILQRQVPFLCCSDEPETAPLPSNTFSQPGRQEGVSQYHGLPHMERAPPRRKSAHVLESDAPHTTPRKPGLLELEMIAIDALTHLRAHNSIHTSPHHSNSTPTLHRHVLWTRTTSSSSFATSSSAPDSYPSEYFSSDDDNSLETSSHHTTPTSPPMLRTQFSPDNGESKAEEEGPSLGSREDGEDVDDGHQDLKELATGHLNLIQPRLPKGRSSQTLGGSSPTPDLTDESEVASDSDSGSTYSDAKRRASTSRRQSLRPRKRRRAQIQREDSQSSTSSHTHDASRPRFKRRPQAMPEVHNAKARRYACRIPGCTWAFARSPERTRHEATHNEREMWKCGHCGLLLSRKDSALRHHYTQHLDQEVQITRAALS